MSLKTIVRYIVTWRLWLVLASFIGSVFIPLRKDFMLIPQGSAEPSLLTIWAGFDGMHYLELAQYWYGTPSTRLLYAYFPVYPWLIRHLNIFKSPLITGLILSHLFLFIALYLLYKLILIDYSSSVAKLTLLLLLIFPTSFFFGSVYTESLFFCLSVGSFYFARKHNYLLAISLATIASATRLSGLFLWPAILIEFMTNHRFSTSKITLKKLVPFFAIPPLGLFSYLRYQFIKTGDYLFFIHQQPQFGANRTIDRLILLYQVFYRYLKMVVFIDHTSFTFFIVVLELVLSTLFLALCFYVFLRMRRSYGVYSLLSFILPTLTGTFSSMPRYILVLFPCFIYLAIWFEQHPKYRLVYITSSLIVSIITTAYFTRGFFIS